MNLIEVVSSPATQVRFGIGL